MKNCRVISGLMVILFLIISCDKVNPPDNHLGPNVFVYKFKEGVNYSEYVPVTLDSTHTRIIGYDTDMGLEDVESNNIYDYKGYYFGVMILNTGYLSVTFEEFDSMIDTLSNDEIQELLMETDPFDEIYDDPDEYLIREDPSLSPIIDTLKFQRLVDNEELDLYLVKVI